MRRLIGLVAVLAAAGCGPGAGKNCDLGECTGGSWLAGAQGALLSTEDGRTFVMRDAGLRNDLLSLFCVTPQVGWAVGHQGSVLVTRDGGAQWTPQKSGVDVTLRGVAFADTVSGIAAGDGGAILWTGDGGFRWSRVASPVKSQLLAATMTGQNAWIAGEGGVILRSTDGGHLFKQVANVPAITLRAVRGARGVPSKVYAAGDSGVILVSDDAGATFREAARSSGALRGLSVSSDGLRAIATGDQGRIVRTTDGGKTWSPVASGTQKTLAAVGFVGQNGWAVGEQGTILHSIDQGASWTALISPTAADLTSAEDL
jgi:photosystem II stability/assembly factor-like uncharacterized protein